MFEVEAGVERPARSGRRRFPFDTMAVDESFLAPPEWATRARNAAAQHKRLHPGWDYVTKHETNGLRIWRTA